MLGPSVADFLLTYLPRVDCNETPFFPTSIYIWFAKFDDLLSSDLSHGQNLLVFYHKNGILLPNLFWPTVRKNCSSDWEKLLEFEAEGREFAKILRSLEQFIQTVKGQNNFW